MKKSLKMIDGSLLDKHKCDYYNIYKFQDSQFNGEIELDKTEGLNIG